MIGLRNFKCIAAGLVAVITLAAADTAAAATCPVTWGNGNAGAIYSLEMSSALACTTGNSSAEALGKLTEPFTAPPEWILSYKKDSEGETKVGPISFSTAPVLGTQSGTWAIDIFPEDTQVVITLKAGDSFGAFLLTPFTTSGTWATTGTNLSNFSVFYRSCATLEEARRLGCGTHDDGGDDTPSPVPLPAAGWLLLGGLGALAAMRRRRAAA